MKTDSKSYSAFYFKLPDTIISLECRKQRNVASSVTEAEYISLFKACEEAIYRKQLLFDIFGTLDPTVLFNDCQSAQKLALSLSSLEIKDVISCGANKFLNCKHLKCQQISVLKYWVLRNMKKLGISSVHKSFLWFLILIRGGVIS